MQKSPFSVGTALQGIQLCLQALLLFLAFGKHFLEPSRRESCPMWAPLREGDFLSYQDEGVRAKYQSSGMWAWNLDNPLQWENVRYICSRLSWEMELERKIRQLCERIKKWNPAELGSIPKLEWCDAFFDELCRVVWMKNEEIRVVSSVVSDMIFLFFCIHLLALRRPKFLLQKIQPLQQSVLE